MNKTGLLILSNLSRIPYLLSASQQHVQHTLYVQLNLSKTGPATKFGKIITQIYSSSVKYCSKLDVRVVVTNLKVPDRPFQRKSVDILLHEGDSSSQSLVREISERFSHCPVVELEQGVIEDRPDLWEEKHGEMYNNVVLGGTFDRLHVGHKILLSAAIIRATERLVVGVTDVEMIKSKKLPELILPVDERIRQVTGFLGDVDDTLTYEVVPISDPFGPTKTDPNLDLIVVSAETLKGGQKVNEVRNAGGLNDLDIYSIELVEIESGEADKELKVSSSNQRMDLLGSKLKKPEAKPHLQPLPYIIGLVGGIASGKSIMAQRFADLGAKVIDCDKLAHQLYVPGGVCYDPIVEHFGRGIVNEDGTINRGALGGMVFSDPEQLTALNGIVWPALEKTVQELISKSYKEGYLVVIVDAAILLQAGWQRNCHEIWSMIIPPEEAVRRIAERNNLPEEEARKRINSQMDNATIVKHSNVVFSSLWSHEFTQKQAEKAWAHLMSEIQPHAKI